MFLVLLIVSVTSTNTDCHRGHGTLCTFLFLKAQSAQIEIFFFVPPPSHPWLSPCTLSKLVTGIVRIVSKCSQLVVSVCGSLSRFCLLFHQCAAAGTAAVLFHIDLKPDRHEQKVLFAGQLKNAVKSSLPLMFMEVFWVWRGPDTTEYFNVTLFFRRRSAGMKLDFARAARRVEITMPNYVQTLCCVFIRPLFLFRFLSSTGFIFLRSRRLNVYSRSSQGQPSVLRLLRHI